MTIEHHTPAEMGEIELLLRKCAEKWRATEGKRWMENGQEQTGYVTIFRGKVVGWSRELDTPKKWEPGVFMVPAGNGKIFVSMGGNADAGADRWVEMS